MNACVVLFSTINPFMKDISGSRKQRADGKNEFHGHITLSYE